MVLVLFLGCQDEPKETPTKGHVAVVAAESVYPLIKQEQQKFEELYNQAHIELFSAETREAIARMYNDTIKVIVCSRRLNDEERQVAKKYNINISEYKIAIDGIAVIVNPENPVTRLRTTQLDSIFSGKVTKWSDVGGNHLAIQVCVPSRNSGTYEVVAGKMLGGTSFTDRALVARSSPEMIRFVSENKASIGLAGLNWLGEKKDSVRVLELSDPAAPDSLGIKGQYFAPFQAHIYRGYYPLARDVYIYSKAEQYGVGAGFITFITSAPGQKIVVNSGLVPATMPVRLVELTNKGTSQ